MKVVMIGLTAFSCAMATWGETFQMDRKGETSVVVTKASDEYRVTCMFRPQTKFDPAVNAKFNDAKGDSLCKKGLSRYLKVGTNETLAVSGQYSAAPVETVGDRLCYSFAVPVAGCEVRKVVPKSTPLPEVASKTTSVTRSSSFLCVTEYQEVNGERTTVSRREYQGRNFKSPKEFDRFCRQEFARIRALGEANIRAVRELEK